jgi:TonB family protein
MTATASAARAKRPSTRRTVVVTIAAAVALALIWAGARMLRTHQDPLSPPAADVVEESSVPVTAEPAPTQPDATLAVPNEAAAPAAPLDANASDAPAELEPQVSAGAITQALPDVPRRARQTIRGHVKVSVRLIVDPDGTVFAALVDDGGPSRYFSRLAIDAAKKWTFAPADTDGQRFVQVRFDFTRDGTTARAMPLK